MSLLSVFDKFYAVTREEVEALAIHFYELKKSPEKAGKKQQQVLLNLDDFHRGFGGSPDARSLFLDRIFAVVFDVDNTGWITAKKFVDGIHRLSANEPYEAKLRTAFDVFNLSGEAGITPSDLSTILRASLEEHEVYIDADSVEDMVSSSFERHDQNRDGMVDFEEFRDMAAMKPNFLRPLTLNISELIEQRTCGAASAEEGR